MNTQHQHKPNTQEGKQMKTLTEAIRERAEQPRPLLPATDANAPAATLQRAAVGMAWYYIEQNGQPRTEENAREWWETAGRIAPYSPAGQWWNAATHHDIGKATAAYYAMVNATHTPPAQRARLADRLTHYPPPADRPTYQQIKRAWVTATWEQRRILWERYPAQVKSIISAENEWTPCPK